MESRQVKTVADAKQIVEERGLDYVKLGVFDVDGIMRGKYVSREKFFSALDKGFGFCDVVLGWDSNDQLYDNVSYTGWHTGYPDAPVRLLPESCRDLSLEAPGLFFLGEFSGEAEAICPRGVLRRVLQHAKKLGFKARAAFEYEFFVFQENRQSVRDKNYRNLTPLAPGYFGYSVLRNSVDSGFYRNLLELGRDMDFPLEGLHEETGPGVLEAAITVDDALAAADKAALFKTFTKVLAQQEDLIATFMAKWSADWPGQSGHVHLSLCDEQDKPLFHDDSKPHAISDVMRHFVAGQQRYMPELLAMVAPTINSYTRLVPGFWAPTHASWGVENRTCALRVIPGSSAAQRIEYRVGAADANPYLILAAALASGLAGFEQQLEPDEAISGNAYEAQIDEKYRLPPTLWQAAQDLKNSRLAKDAFGEAFVAHFAATREWEEREFRKHISDWELQRYFEII